MNIWASVWGSAVLLAGGAMAEAQTAPKPVTSGAPADLNPFI